MDETTMTENPAEVNDYKFCPLKGGQAPLLSLWNLDPPPDLTGLASGGVLQIRADDEPPRLEYVGGRCDGPRCAWWDADKERCAVLSIARSK